jgi:hypothetical protein
MSAGHIAIPRGYWRQPVDRVLLQTTSVMAELIRARSRAGHYPTGEAIVFSRETDQFAIVRYETGDLLFRLDLIHRKKQQEAA